MGKAHIIPGWAFPRHPVCKGSCPGCTVIPCTGVKGLRPSNSPVGMLLDGCDHRGSASGDTGRRLLLPPVVSADAPLPAAPHSHSPQLPRALPPAGDGYRGRRGGSGPRRSSHRLPCWPASACGQHRPAGPSALPMATALKCNSGKGLRTNEHPCVRAGSSPRPAGSGKPQNPPLARPLLDTAPPLYQREEKGGTGCKSTPSGHATSLDSAKGFPR